MSASIFIDNKYTRIYYKIVNRAQQRVKPEGYLEKHHIIPQSFFKSKNKTGWLSGDPNAKKNCVFLTAKEHYICHLLLIKMTEGRAYYKMAHAMMRLANGLSTRQYVSCTRYESVKKLFSEAKKGRPCSPETREKIRQGNLKRPPTSDETRKKLSAAAKRRKGFTEEGRRRVSEAGKNRIVTEEMKENLREARKRQVERQGDTMTVEARKKLSQAAKGRKLPRDHVEKIAQANKGKTRSDEFRKAVSERMTGHVKSEETLQKLSLAAKGKPQRVVTCPHCEKSGGISVMKRWHFDNCEATESKNKYNR